MRERLGSHRRTGSEEERVKDLVWAEKKWDLENEYGKERGIYSRRETGVPTEEEFSELKVQWRNDPEGTGEYTRTRDG